MDNRTWNLLEHMFILPEREAGRPNIRTAAESWGLPLYRLERGEVFLHGGDAADTAFFLLDGTARVVLATKDGEEGTIDEVSAPHIFGITEVIQSRASYGASVVAASACLIARLPAEEFLANIRQSADAGFTLIRYLAWVATRNMNKAKLKALATPKTILGEYLYQAGLGRPLPFTLRQSRKSISEELHINLRTLYRYLAQFKEQGYIQILRGRVIITEAQFKKLEADFHDVLGWEDYTRSHSL